MRPGHSNIAVRRIDSPRRLRRGGRLAALLVCFSAFPAAIPAHAAGIGGFEVQSSLGQRLRLVVQVTARADEVIDANCFKVNPFTVASDGLPQLTSAQIALERGGSQPRLVITSARPINDPIVRVSLEIGCATTLRRDLTLLLDPAPAISSAAEAAPAAAASGTAPGAAGAPAADAARSPGAAQTSAPGADAPGAETGSGSTSSAAPAAAAAGTPRGALPPPSAVPPRRVERAPRPDSAPQARRDQPRTAPRPVTRAPDAASRPPAPSASTRAAVGTGRDRLSIAAGPSLDSPIDAPLTPRLTLSTSLSDRSGQPPMSESALGILRQKQARLRAAPAEEDIPSLEAELVVLQKKAAELRTQLDKAIADMQALSASVPKTAGSDQPAPAAQAAATPVQSLPEAQLSQRSWFDSRTLFAAALAFLIALLIAVLVMWARRERATRRQQERWNQSPYVPATTQSGMPPAVPRAKPKLSPIEEAIAQIDSTRSNERSAALPDNYAFSSSHAASQLGVSDLAQATEKASVFMTLGRPEQAIETLRDHIDHETKPSPMAWLMLLDLYRQGGQREAFTEVAERFHLRFNAETPQWELPNGGEDAGLVTFPRVIGMIRQDWPNPASLACIETLVYDNRGGSRIGFSLEAFRDLLLLHSILDEYRIELAEPPRTDPVTGEAIPVPVPDPPSHLARAWIEAPAPPPRRAPPTLELDVNLLADSPDCSALERGLPVVAEAIMTRWGRPGTADYLTNLISLSKDDRNSDMSSEMLAELLMLQEVASTLEETAESRDLSFR